MHPTAQRIVGLALEIYSSSARGRVLEIGSRDVSEFLRACNKTNIEHVSIDVDKEAGVPLARELSAFMPAGDATFDLVLASSACEHDPAFWRTFVEMCRLTAPSGFIYISVLSNGSVQQHSCVNGRFYACSCIALNEWAQSNGQNIELIESFWVEQDSDIRRNFIAVWQKQGVNVKRPSRLISDEVPGTNVTTWRTDKVWKEGVERQDLGLLDERNSLYARLQSMQSEKIRLDAELAEQSHVRKALKAELDEVRSRCVETHAMLQDSSRRLVELSTELVALKHASGRERTELAEIREQRDSFAADLDATRHLLNLTTSSTAWRITAPVRRVLERLSPGQRLFLRRLVKVAYWAVTPHRTSQRVTFLRNRSGSERQKIEVAAPADESTDLGGDQPDAQTWLPTRLFDESKKLRVVFVSGDSDSPSHTYRVLNMARGLREIGCETEIVPLHELWRLGDRVQEFHVAVFWRLAIGNRFAWSTEVEAIVQCCEHHGVAVFFDIDDLVFDLGLCDPCYVDGLRYLTKEQLVEYKDGVRGYRDMMVRCGTALVTTSALKRYAEKYGVRTFVIPNGLDQFYESALEWPLIRSERNTVVIGYTPGTTTHQKDFAAAAPALARLLSRNPKVQLWVLGPLDLVEFPELKSKLGSQVIVNEGVGRARVFAFQQQIDINIAPLESGNPFTEAKSELKYFEPAVFGVPTVAAAIGPYNEVIESGRNGYTVKSEEEWLDALSALVNDQALRYRIGDAARLDVKEHYRAHRNGRRLKNAFEVVRSDLRAKARGEVGWTLPKPTEAWPDIQDYRSERPLFINWLVSELIIGSGGHRMILRAAYLLSCFGHRIRLYFTDTDLSSWRIRDEIRQHFYPIDCPIYVYDGTMKPADVLFATYWKTVPIALRHSNVCNNIFYYVQDFEPHFFPMSSDYINAENTYRQGLYAITAGEWCAHFIREKFKGDADSFKFPIQDIYKLKRRVKRNINILFFAKPEMARRCYDIGVQVLHCVHKLRPEVEIITFGSDKVSQESLPFPATCKGVQSVEQLADLYTNADVGIAFAPTNPSAVPYEMMACGLPVVDLDLPDAKQNYGGTRDVVLLGSPVPSVMAKEIVELLDDDDERKRRSKAGVEFVSNFPTEIGMARRIESLIVKRLERLDCLKRTAGVESDGSPSTTLADYRVSDDAICSSADIELAVRRDRR